MRPILADHRGMARSLIQILGSALAPFGEPVRLISIESAGYQFVDGGGGGGGPDPSEP
jgi:hypothetical protein